MNVKNVLTFCASVLMINQLSAQVNQKTAIASTNHGDEYHQFHSIEKGEEKYTGEQREKMYYILHRNNVLGELSYFFMDDEVSESRDIKGTAADPKVDHFTEPSIIYTPMAGRGYVLLDDIVYQFKRAKLESILKGNFEIEYIYVPKKLMEEEKNKPKQEKEKGGFLNKVKSKMSGSGLTSYIADRDHKVKLQNYFKEMQEKQEKASANLTSEQKEKIAKVDEIRGTNEASRMKESAKSWAETRKANEGVGELGDDELMIINETGSSVCLVQGGSTSSFTGKSKFDCNEPVYWGVKKGDNCTSDKRGVAVSAGQCGKEVVLK